MRRSLPMTVALCLRLGGLIEAGVAPLGPEFQVNTYTTSLQFIPSVGVNDAGGYVVVWVSNLQDGSNRGVFGQLFDSAGGRVGAEFQVNTYTTGLQYVPQVAMAGAGDFVVAWSSHAQDGSAFGVFGQLFDSAGGRVGAEFQVNSYTTYDQYRPAVAMSGSGDFVVVWESLQDGDGAGVFGQLFDGGGVRVGVEFQVNTYTTDSEYNASVAMNGVGDFTVAWISENQNGSYFNVFGRRFDSSGSPLGGEFQLNTSTSTYQHHPVVAASSVGDFVVAWRKSYDGSDTGVAARLFDSSGSAVTGEFQANTYTTTDQSTPAVAMDGNGDFVVVWESRQDGDGAGIIGKQFDSGGNPLGVEFQVNTYTTDYQLSPSVAMNGNGDFMVAWNSNGQDGSNSAVIAQRGLKRGPAITSHGPGATVDCSDPALSRPTFLWLRGDYDRFKVYMGSSPGFEDGTRVTSGDQKIVLGSWTPGKKKWKAACNKALTQSEDPNDPQMYIAVGGIDQVLSSKDPRKRLLSFPVRVQVQP